MSGIPALQPPPSLVNCVAWVPWTTSLTSWVALWLTFSAVRLHALYERVSSSSAVSLWCKPSKHAPRVDRNVPEPARG